MSPGPSRPKRVDATSADAAAFDQVARPHTYRLAEAEGAEAFDDDFRVRTCDLSRFLRGDARERRRCAHELGQALEEIGFAILAGHGVPAELFAACEHEVLALFTRHPLEEKLRFRARRHGAVNQGYFPLQETSDLHPDLVEGWVLARRAFRLAGEPEPALGDFWPDPAHERVLRELVRAQEPLVAPLMQAVLLHLGCDPHLYDARLARPSLALRLNHYPPVPADAPAGAGRLLGHEDTDLFTLLPAPRSEGLQVLNRANGRWVRLDAPPGTIVLNVGDYLQRISNDVLPSTTHRVAQPRDPALRAATRVSFPMNVYLREDDWLEVLPCFEEPRYEPIRALVFHTRTTARHYGEGYAVEEAEA